jgi:Fanconi anemia group M protein
MQAVSLIAQVIKIRHAKSLAESETVAALNEYLQGLWDQSTTSKNRGLKSIVNDFNLIRAYSIVKKLIEHNKEHPKLQKLQETIKDMISQNKNAKILVFTEYRANIKPILEKLQESKLDVEKFIGQSHGQEKGMNQKEQARVLNRFRNNELHALIATSVAEEGLDIPSVDSVIFYSPIPSGVRTIQRKGRTGRHSRGNLTILITKGSKDVAYTHISRRKEKAMKTILNPKDKTLKDFGKWSK